MADTLAAEAPSPTPQGTKVLFGYDQNGWFENSQFIEEARNRMSPQEFDKLMRSKEEMKSRMSTKGATPSEAEYLDSRMIPKEVRFSGKTPKPVIPELAK